MYSDCKITNYWLRFLFLLFYYPPIFVFENSYFFQTVSVVFEWDDLKLFINLLNTYYYCKERYINGKDYIRETTYDLIVWLMLVLFITLKYIMYFLFQFYTSINIKPFRSRYLTRTNLLSDLSVINDSKHNLKPAQSWTADKRSTAVIGFINS